MFNVLIEGDLGELAESLALHGSENDHTFRSELSAGSTDLTQESPTLAGAALLAPSVHCPI